MSLPFEALVEEIAFDLTKINLDQNLAGVVDNPLMH